jgi:hypothetical protein
MKKQVTLLLAILLSITIASAAPTLKIQNQNNIIQPGETLLAQIEVLVSEEFTKQISLDEIEFYKGRKKIFVEHDLVFRENTHYLYAYINQEGNFTIKIPNILYKDVNTGDPNSISIEQEIEVKEIRINGTEPNTTTTEILSIKPGFFYSSDKKAEFVIINQGESELNITYGLPNQTLTNLQPGQSEKITIKPTATTEQPIQFLTFSTYQDFTVPIIPVSLTAPGEDQDLRPDPRYLHVNLISSQDQEETIQLFNFADTAITNIQLALPEGLSFMAIRDSPQQLTARSVANITLSFSAEQEGFFQEDLTITYTLEDEQNTLTIPVIAYIFPEGTPEEDLTFSEDSCSMTGGFLCESGDICDGVSSYASDGFCCVGVCEPKELPKVAKSYGWVWGTIIFIVLGVIGFLIYKKIKKTKPAQPKEQFKKTAKAYETRVSGGLART